MDLIAFLISQAEEDMDEEAADDEAQQIATVAAIAIGGTLADSQRRIWHMWVILAIWHAIRWGRQTSICGGSSRI
jgi:uncharacterized protein (DUF983 family)